MVNQVRSVTDMAPLADFGQPRPLFLKALVEAWLDSPCVFGSTYLGARKEQPCWSLAVERRVGTRDWVGRQFWLLKILDCVHGKTLLLCLFAATTTTTMMRKGGDGMND